METYELGAHYFSKKCKMPKADMPFMFFIGDEAPYPKLTSGIVSDVMGNTIANDYASKKVFQGLFKKFQDNVFFLQNPYCGNRTRDTEEIKEEWINIVGREYAEHIIPITEEKSVIDVILGTIAMVSNTRDMRQYMGDMEQRGQTSRRRRNVEQSLGGLEAVVAAKAGKKKSGAKRL